MVSNLKTQKAWTTEIWMPNQSKQCELLGFGSGLNCYENHLFCGVSATAKMQRVTAPTKTTLEIPCQTFKNLS